MKEQTLIHVKIDYEEALQSKRDLLSSEREFLQVLKILKRYHLLRKEELTTKLKIQNKIKELKINLKKLTETLPKIKISPIKKEEIKKEEKPAATKTKEEKEEDDLEKQLRDIQDKLRSLS